MSFNILMFLYKLHPFSLSFLQVPGITNCCKFKDKPREIFAGANFAVEVDIVRTELRIEKIVVAFPATIKNCLLAGFTAFVKSLKF